MDVKKIITVILILLSSFPMAACQPAWEIELTNQDQAAGIISRNDVTFYIEKSQEEVDVVPLGQLLYANGFDLVEEISLIDEDGDSISFVWDEIASVASLSESGIITIDNFYFTPSSIDVIPSSLASTIELSIMDIAPTMADVLGLPDLPNSTKNSKFNGTAKVGVMIIIDGTQYQKLISMISSGKLPFFENLQEIQRGLTVYPPITTSATAAFLTGTPPEDNGVYGYGYRSTELTTLFDLAVDNGMRVIAIEGASLAFNLRNAETTISGDRDGNGYSDDNVYENSLGVIQTDMPDLLFVHFHEIDDMGHTYGPDSSEYENALIRVDEYLSQLVEALPVDTFIAIFADHGMHATEDGGNHGTLTSSDLLIPIIFLEK